MMMIITMAINAKIISIKIIMITITRAVFDEEYWVGYRTVNEKFAEETLKALRGMEKVFFYHLYIASSSSDDEVNDHDGDDDSSNELMTFRILRMCHSFGSMIITSCWQPTLSGAAAHHQHHHNTHPLLN